MNTIIKNRHAWIQLRCGLWLISTNYQFDERMLFHHKVSVLCLIVYDCLAYIYEYRSSFDEVDQETSKTLNYRTINIISRLEPTK